METVAFYSYKGGVGRTLLVANTAQFLAMSGRRVVALDLDLEAPGLQQKLAAREGLTRAQNGEITGAIDELLDTFESEPRNASLRNIAIEVGLPPDTRGSLLLIPAGAAPSHAYWSALERLNNYLRTCRTNGGLLEAVLRLQARISSELKPEFLLVDSRTGITELGGLATSLLADRVVCLTTTAPESVEGTRVVADALRSAPRLSSQRPLRIDFLVTRVPSPSIHSSNLSSLIKQLGGSTAVLPHDSGIASEERILLASGTGQSKETSREDAGNELFSATLRWIADSFPVHKQDADRTRRRLETVHRAWRELTSTSERVRAGTRSRQAWPIEQLAERVRVNDGKQSRQADIIVYDRPTQDSSARPLMILEYVDNEDRDTVAHWWFQTSRVPVVVLFSDNSDRRLYSGRKAWDARAHHSDRWDLPLPHDFEALPDPTDISIDMLLDSVARGHADYLDRLVTEWVRSSAAGLHGGAPWKPQIAKQIIDGFARVDDVELARRVLWAASADWRHRGMWLGDGDDYLEEQVLAELFTPLLWRMPPEASIALMGGRGRPFGPPPGIRAISLLAHDILGLHYDPDATFRIEGQRMLDRVGHGADSDPDRGLYGLGPAFKHLEISFEMSSEPPPLARPGQLRDEEKRRPPDLEHLISERIVAGSLVTTGLLGNYQPALGKVVLYSEAISHCADKLALRARHVGSVTLVHETLHALAHLGRDLDGHMWPEFSLPDASSPLFEPSRFHEVLTQYFTYQQLLRLRDPALLHAFEVMSTKQVSPYREWKRLLALPLEDMRSWFMAVRRGVGFAATPPLALLYAMRQDT